MGVAPAKMIFMVNLSFEVALVSSPISQLLQKKETNKCKEKFVILQSIGIIPKKNSQSSMPADIPGDIFNPFNLANGLND